MTTVPGVERQCEVPVKSHCGIRLEWQSGVVGAWSGCKMLIFAVLA